MDKLEKTLRDDAAKISVSISPELDNRIRASLEGVSPAKPAGRPRRSVSMWWASSLTGVAAAIGVIVWINWNADLPGGAAEEIGVANVNGTVATPPILPELDARAAMLADPLEQELEDLEADLRKAGRAVRADIGFDM
jgi:hypothetical protein